MSIIPKNSKNISRYIILKNDTTGAPAVGYTITNLDLQYTRNREEPAAKVDATALADQDSPFSANEAIEIDGTSSPGLYRVDWPDAAFVSGADKVILCVSGSGLQPAYEEIDISNDIVGLLSGTHTLDHVDLGDNAPGVDQQVRGMTLVNLTKDEARYVWDYDADLGRAFLSPATVLTWEDDDAWQLYPSAPPPTESTALASVNLETWKGTAPGDLSADGNVPSNILQVNNNDGLTGTGEPGDPVTAA